MLFLFNFLFRVTSLSKGRGALSLVKSKFCASVQQKWCCRKDIYFLIWHVNMLLLMEVKSLCCHPPSSRTLHCRSDHFTEHSRAIFYCFSRMEKGTEHCDAWILFLCDTNYHHITISYPLFSVKIQNVLRDDLLTEYRWHFIFHERAILNPCVEVGILVLCLHLLQPAFKSVCQRCSSVLGNLVLWPSSPQTLSPNTLSVIRALLNRFTLSTDDSECLRGDKYCCYDSIVNTFYNL